MLIEIKRLECGDDYTLGTMLVDGLTLGHTLEDTDRRLEDVGIEAKVKGKTAIPRGRYEVVMTYSNRFHRMMPEVLGVPGFTAIRIHGGNTHEDTEGCPLLGAIREADGVIRDCAGVNALLRRRIEIAERRKERVWLEVS